ncbi:tyrosine-type recombinase/integrase [Arthrobacter sp. ISL-95]|nr:tyrosine-type recombinase/integrase [Arthrobacter sp. ISL-95]MBT2586488.1 tyrosine-type recombinase/integrase [Arthrobacter sp. ISL-95]
MAREHEPEVIIDGVLTSYGSRVAVPFALLPEPVRSELLFAVQGRDLAGTVRFDPLLLRMVYLDLRRRGVTSAVGLTLLGQPKGHSQMRVFREDLQRRIDQAHRDWSGLDPRDDGVLYLADLPMRESQRSFGHKAKIDLRGISQDWLAQSVAAWMRHGGPHNVSTLYSAQHAWTLIDQILSLRGTPRAALGAMDMDAVIKGVREKWPQQHPQAKVIRMISQVISFARREASLSLHWRDVPAQFAIEQARHAAVGKPSRSAANVNEPFRYTPAPVIDWVMDHIQLIDRGNAYSTAEARVLIYLQERCGRRTSETVRLKEDCISYDHSGSPYLNWTQAKPPREQGPRLPIHQETHDMIREWQQIKADHGVVSQWLFPTFTGRRDHHRADTFLNQRLREFLKLLSNQAPFTSPVEGAEGNLVYFDLTTIDPYSFRHSFAQRLADAVDENGISTTPPDVLRELMGHKSHGTTMAYYEVTAKRRKKAMASLPPRRLDINGAVVPFDREREGFGKIALTVGTCTEPQNVAANGHFCSVDYACEACPFFLVDPLERDAMEAKRQHLKVKYERARAIQARQHVLDYLLKRIDDCSSLIGAIDSYIASLQPGERRRIGEGPGSYGRYPRECIPATEDRPARDPHGRSLRCQAVAGRRSGSSGRRCLGKRRRPLARRSWLWPDEEQRSPSPQWPGKQQYPGNSSITTPSCTPPSKRRPTKPGRHGTTTRPRMQPPPPGRSSKPLDLRRGNSTPAGTGKRTTENHR